MSLKVIDNGNIRQKNAYDVLFAFNSNNASISYCLRSTTSILSKVLDFHLPHLHCWRWTFAYFKRIVCSKNWTPCRLALFAWSQVQHKAVMDRRLRPPGGLLYVHVILLTLYTHGHYVQAWCHKYSTHPLRPCRPWLQEVVRCLQRVLLHAKPQAEYVWASLPQPSSGVEQPVSLCANMTSSIKPEICNVSLCRQMRTKPRPLVTCTKNLVKIGSVVPEIWS